MNIIYPSQDSNRLKAPLLEGGHPEDTQRNSLTSTVNKSLDETLGPDQMAASDSPLCSHHHDHKVIQFKQLLDEHRQRTEFNMPHTIMQVEDVMFLKEDRVIALEYIFYNNDSTYQQISVQSAPQNTHSHKKDGDAKGLSANMQKLLGNSLMTKVEEQKNKRDVMDAYQTLPTELFPETDPNKGYIKTHRAHQHCKSKGTECTHRDQVQQEEHAQKLRKIKFIELRQDDQVVAYIEPLISIWRINRDGHLSKIKEQSFNLKVKWFDANSNKHMKFSLSNDLQIVSLSFVNEKKQPGILAWEIDKDDLFRRIRVENNLSKALQRQTISSQEELKTLKYLDGGKYLLLVIKMQTAITQKTQESWVRLKKVASSDMQNEYKYIVYELDGSIAFQFMNKSQGVVGNYHCIGMVPNEASKENQEPKFEVCDSSDEDNEYDAADSNLQQPNQRKLQAPKNDETVKSPEIKVQRDIDNQLEDDLALTLFFVEIDPKALDKPDKEHLEILRLTKSFKDFSCAYKEGNLSDFIQNLVQEESCISRNDEDNPRNLRLPKSWFAKEEENGKPCQLKQFYNKIWIGTTVDNNQVGFLNQKEHLFLAFRKKQVKSGWIFENIGQQHIPQKSLPSIVRNQSTKNFLCLILKIKGNGTTAFCFHSRQVKSQIRLKDDYLTAQQDVILQTYTSREIDGDTYYHGSDNDDAQSKTLDHTMSRKRLSITSDIQRDVSKQSEYFRLQSCSISEGDQSILLKTSDILDQHGEIKTVDSTKRAFRKSYNQRHYGNFPIFVYNLGQRKLIIQNTQGDQVTYIYELPFNEHFINFVEFNDFKDLGFFDEKADLSSNFAYLTRNTKNGHIHVNILRVNPYLKSPDNEFKTQPSFKIFKSKRFFQQLSNNRDIIIKNVMYHTKKHQLDMNYDFKIIFQFSQRFETYKFQMPYDIIQYNEEELDDKHNETVIGYNDMQRWEDENEINMEKVCFTLNDQGKIFYVISKDDVCQVKQIDPKDDSRRKHLTILETQSKHCRHFGFYNDSFFFIDDQYVITKYTQHRETNMLMQVNQLFIKDKDKPYLNIRAFDKVIIHDDFLINHSKIFYINAQTPNSDGILDMENLKDEDIFKNRDCHKDKAPQEENQKDQEGPGPSTLDRAKKRLNHISRYIDGPFEMRGSEQFIVVYMYGKVKQMNQRIYELPDSTSTSLINETNKQVNFSTFINIDESPAILVNVGDDFAIFDENGVFKSLVFFEGLHQQDSHQLITMSNNGEFFLFLNKSNQFEVFNLKSKKPSDLKNKSAPNSPAEKTEDSQQEQANYSFFPNNAESRQRASTVALLPNAQLPLAKQKSGPMITQTLIKQKLEQKIVKIVNDYHKFIMPKKHNEKVVYEFRQWYIIDQNEINKSDEAYLQFANKVKDGQMNCHIDQKGRVTFIRAESDTVHFKPEKHEIEVDLNIIQFEKSDDNKQKLHLNLHTQTDLFGNFNQTVEKMQSFKSTLTKIDEDEVFLKIQQEHDLEQFIDKQESLKLQDLKKQQNILSMNQIKCQKFDWYNTSDPSDPNTIKELLIVNCGHQVFFKKIEKKDDQIFKIGYKSSQLNFKEMLIDFNEDTEFLAFLETQKVFFIQILAHDKKNNIFMIITWDFNKNIEESMFQVDSRNKPDIESQVVRGLNQKMNYFVDEDFINDLEYSIPMQKTNSEHSSWYQQLTKNTRLNQQQVKSRQFMKHMTKVFKDDSRYLCIEHSNVLVFQASRIALKFWNDYEQRGSNIQDMKNNFKLELFKSILNRQSLFHYFANKQDIFTVVYQYFKEEQNESKHNEQQLNNTPLLMLHPNNKRKTALEMSLDARRPKVFQLMLDLLEPFDGRMLAHMLINQLPFIIRNCNQLNLKFLDTCVYQSYTMKIPLVIDWPSGLSELCFSSHTSMITSKEAKRQIKRRVKIDNLKMGYMQLRTKCSTQQHDLQKIDLSNDKSGHICKICKQKIGEKGSIHQKRNQGFWIFEKMFPKNLHCPTCKEYYCADCIDEEIKDFESDPHHSHNLENMNEEENIFRNKKIDLKQKIPTIMKVNVEVIDFNFIFQNDNVTSFLMMLAEQGTGEIFVQTSIKVFVNILWQDYFYQIRKWIFYPYILYMLTFVFYASEFAGSFQDLQYKINHRDSDITDEEYEELLHHEEHLRTIVIVLSALNILGGIWFTGVEIMQLKQVYKINGNLKEYYTDHWNYFDWVSIITNQTLVFLVLDNLIRQKQHILTSHIRMIGSFACFFMWFKTFYWMRLFKLTAHFVTLITQTVSELKTFFLMFIICVIAFANFFYILNNNTSFNKNNTREYLYNAHPNNPYYQDPDKFEKFQYVKRYTGQSFLDAMITVYFVSLGEMVYDDFDKGDNVKLIYLFFILSTVFIYIVFMNVIIAIINSIFAKVSQRQEQSDLYEKISLIQDFIWQIDLEKKFKYKKYIIRLSADNSSHFKEVDMLEQLKHLSNLQMNKIQDIQQQMVERIAQSEQRTMTQLNDQKHKMKKNVSSLKQSISHSKSDVKKIITKNSFNLDVNKDIDNQYKKSHTSNTHQPVGNVSLIKQSNTKGEKELNRLLDSPDKKKKEQNQSLVLENNKLETTFERQDEDKSFEEFGTEEVKDFKEEIQGPAKEEKKQEETKDDANPEDMEETGPNNLDQSQETQPPIQKQKTNKKNKKNNK